MAGYLSGKELENLAICGARMILQHDELIEVFDENPDGCYRALMVQFLFNENFIQPIVDKHPSFLPIAEKFRQAIRNGEHPDDICVDMFNSSLDIYQTESYQYDVNFNVMLATILNNCFTKEVREEYKGAFISVIEQCDEVVGLIPITLLACALWGADYEDFRELSVEKFHEWKVRRSSEEKENPNENSQGGSAEAEKQRKLAEARANVDHFDEKIRFILDVNAQAEANIDSLDSKIDIGKRYTQYYMEIEKYYMEPMNRIKFVAFCADAQPESLLKKDGFVPFDYYTAQIEKCIGNLEFDQRIQFIRTIAARANSLAGWEMIQAIAEGDYDLQSYGWQRISRYIYSRSEEWGWDCLMEDGTKWGGVPSEEKPPDQTQPQRETRPTTPSSQTYNANVSSNHETKSGGCYVATAVYGTYDCPEVWTLRRFRDYGLAGSWYGRIFIHIYYAVSPILVRWFGKTMWFQRFWKGKLDRLVKELQDQGYEDGPYQDENWR